MPLSRRRLLAITLGLMLGSGCSGDDATGPSAGETYAAAIARMDPLDYVWVFENGETVAQYTRFATAGEETFTRTELRGTVLVVHLNNGASYYDLARAKNIVIYGPTVYLYY